MLRHFFYERGFKTSGGLVLRAEVREQSREGVLIFPGQDLEGSRETMTEIVL